MDKYTKVGVSGILIIVFICIFLSIGWVMNLVKFVKCDFKAPYKTEVIRGVGISSYGAIIGWMKIGEEKDGLLK